MHVVLGLLLVPQYFFALGKLSSGFGLDVVGYVCSLLHTCLSYVLLHIVLSALPSFCVLSSYVPLFPVLRFLLVLYFDPDRLALAWLLFSIPTYI